MKIAIYSPAKLRNEGFRHGESAVSPLCALRCVHGSVLAASSDAAPRAVGPGRPVRRQRGPLGRASPEHPPPSGVGSVNALTDRFAQMTALRPLYPGAGPQLANLLRGAGLRDVKARTVTVRVGRRTTRGGRLMLTDYLSLLERMTPIMAQLGLASQEQWQAWLAQARQETNTSSTRVDLTAAYGRR